MVDDFPKGELGSQRNEEARNKDIRLHRAGLREALRWLVADERGLAYLAEIVRESRALERVQCPTPELVMFVDGQRSLGFKVLNDVRALDPARALFADLCRRALDPLNDDKESVK